MPYFSVETNLLNSFNASSLNGLTTFTNRKQLLANG